MKGIAVILVGAGMTLTPAHAGIRLPAVISDHMVLQANASVAIWGWADPGEGVEVSVAGQSGTTLADADGRWQVKLGAIKATREPQTLIVTSKTTSRASRISDVLVGEVWLASGQSNMEMQIKGEMHGSVDRADEEIAAADLPQIRLFAHDKPYAIYDLPVPPTEPMTDRAGAWRICSPRTVADFSAIGYFFARDLHGNLRVPVGILSAAVGGTPIEAWTSRDAQRQPADLQPMLEDWEKRLSGYDPKREQGAFLDAKKVWLNLRSEAVKAGMPAPKAPSPFKNLGVMAPGALFNGVIVPLIPYTLRGCIWYQGERNAAGPFTGLYGVQLKTLIADWRSRWGDDFYFAWVQLPRFQKEQHLPSEEKGWGVAVRDEMRKALSVPRTGMAITIDYGGATAGHPSNKADFAKRLSALVLHEVYQAATEAWSGPILRSARREGGRFVLTFDHASGLKSSGGKLRGFAIAGGDRKFVWAEAEIANGSVAVWSDAIPEPAAVRYGWAANPNANLVNGAGLPASPFRTDNWK